MDFTEAITYLIELVAQGKLRDEIRSNPLKVLQAGWVISAAAAGCNSPLSPTPAAAPASEPRTWRRDSSCCGLWQACECCIV